MYAYMYACIHACVSATRFPFELDNDIKIRSKYPSTKLLTVALLRSAKTLTIPLISI